MSGGLILAVEELAAWREGLREAGRRLVLTNGCFDLLHAGHVTYLQEARHLGDALLVAVNSDESVRALKGPSRPINNAGDRCVVLAALRAVDAVTVFTTPRVTSIISLVRPDIYAKGGDYTPETLDPDEAAALRDCGADIQILSLVPGKSTTATLQKLRPQG